MGKRHKPEEITAKLRQVEVMTGQGTSMADGRKVYAWVGKHRRRIYPLYWAPAHVAPRRFGEPRMPSFSSHSRRRLYPSLCESALGPRVSKQPGSTFRPSPRCRLSLLTG